MKSKKKPAGFKRNFAPQDEPAKAEKLGRYADQPDEKPAKKRDPVVVVATEAPAPPESVELVTQNLHVDASGAGEIIKAMVISTATEFETAIAITTDVKAQRARVEELRQSFVGPMNLSVKRINAFFKPVDLAYAEAEATLKTKILAYRDQQEREREKLLKEAEAEGQGGSYATAASIIDQAEATVVPKVVNFSVTKVWDGEIIDASKLPREYLVPDVAKLKAVTKACKGDPKIPGWRAFQKDIATVRQA